MEGILKLTNNENSLSDSIIKENKATKVLMGDYTQIDMTPLSMMRTPKIEDSIMREARLAASLRESSTPLVGGENSESDLQNYVNQRKTELIKNAIQLKTPTVFLLLFNNHISLLPQIFIVKIY